MHVWIVEIKESKRDKWIVWDAKLSRDEARKLNGNIKTMVYKTRVVKYISTKGE